jgi:hypothetical protein
MQVRHFTLDRSVVGDAVICIRVALAPETSSFHIDNMSISIMCKYLLHVTTFRGRVPRATT